MRDGTVNKCKMCNKEDNKQHRNKNIDEVREYDRGRSGNDRHKDPKAYKMKNPIKRKAHLSVTNAVRDGRLSKPRCCEYCGKEKRLCGHHTSYKKDAWLAVVWLCQICHSAEHIRLKALGITLE